MRRKIRRVVTGHAPDGQSIFVGDDAPPRVVTVSGMKGFSVTAVWATDHGMTVLPGSDDPTGKMTTFVPGEGGTRLLVTVVPPDSTVQRIDPAMVAIEMVAKLPGLGDAMEPETLGMHTTDTVDYDIIMSGELCLELDDGQEVRLKAGDIVVQNGTRHRWRNKAKRPCMMYSVLIGALRRLS